VSDSFILHESLWQGLSDTPALQLQKRCPTRFGATRQGWRESWFCHRNSGAFQAVLAPQRDMGEVHARAELAMLLVARGMRLPKPEIISRLLM